MRRGAQAGSVLVVTVMVLPVMLLMLTLVVASGSLFSSRGSLQGAVDMAALAGVQELDWDALAGGEIQLVEDQALYHAHANLMQNLALVPRGVVCQAEITIMVLNARPGEPLQHPGSGRSLTYPTVWVRVRVPVRAVGLPAGRHIWLWATADASVEPRR